MCMQTYPYFGLVMLRVGITPGLLRDDDEGDDDDGPPPPPAPPPAAAAVAENFEATDGAVGATFHEAATDWAGGERICKR